MGTGDGGSGVAWGPAEVLYPGQRTRVCRVQLPGGAGSIIYKQPVGPDATRRRRHERAILERLAGVEGVSRLASSPHPSDVIALEDVSGVQLATALRDGRLEVAAILDISLRLAQTLAAVHRCGVVHNDITPANILLSDLKRGPVLIDFDLATTAAEGRPSFTHQSEIAGTLAYLAPERTGRTGRPVDQRADLYALGATLYELCTGRPPFEGEDPLQLIHDHMARLPTPPARLDPRLPEALSAIVLRLLEKEPDRRYQSADGLAHDLALLQAARSQGDGRSFVLGARDFPMRLAAPSRLVGRDSEIAALRAAFAATLVGPRRGLLIAGAPGVGKSALIDELRPMVTAQRGWLVSGKFDQFRHDAPSAVAQALRALGGLLLAEPEARLVEARERILRALGPNAGMLTATVPELAILLGPQPKVTPRDPVEGGIRLRQAGLELLRAVVSPARPIVMVLDDLQWATPISIQFMDDLVTDEPLRGLLVVGAYRDAEVDATHPLSAMLARWERLGVSPAQLRLHNLPLADLGVLLADMLRLQPEQATGLADAVGARTAGNPYDTVELVNALRRDGALSPGVTGWSWDAATIRRYVGQGDVVDLLATRIAALPANAQALLESVACLGGEVKYDLLQAASGLSTAALEEQLAPPLDDGLLVMEQGGSPSVRFRHDRVQQAAYGRLEPAARRLLHLALARRLAASPELEVAAGEQYLSAVDLVEDPGERRRVALLFRSAAANARLVNYPLAERCLRAAITLLSPVQTPADAPLLVALETELHAALYSLARLDEADEVYRSIEARRPDTLGLADAACVQISSITNRGSPRQAVDLGLALLARLGLEIPQGDFGAAVARRLDAFYDWIAAIQPGDSQRPETDDPRVRTAAKLIDRLLAPAYFTDPMINSWLVLESQRLWAENGPCAAMVSNLGPAMFATVALRRDYRTGTAAVRHAIAVGEARGYEPQTSFARFLFALGAHWFEPLEDSAGHAQRAHEGLVHGGDLHLAGQTFFASVPALFVCAATLDVCADEIEAGLAFTARTGNQLGGAPLLSFRQLLRALRGETDAPGAFADATFDEDAHLAQVGKNPLAVATFHLQRALSAALFGDMPRLTRHIAATTPLLPFIDGFYLSAELRLLQCLALAERARVAEPAERSALLVEFDVVRDWLASRAVDMPGNFLHLVRLVDAERAWALADFRGALSAFDAALDEVGSRVRPWHRAFIAERAALFHLGHGLARSGRALLIEARRCYQSWGASAKVRELDRVHAFLSTDADPRRLATTGAAAAPAAAAPSPPNAEAMRGSSGVSADAIDLLAILSASQALSSETHLGRLKARVGELLGAMTGATAIQIAIWRDEPRGWFLSASADVDAAPIALDEAGARGLLPLSAFNYAERTGEPLLVEDATRDPRFAHDPYLTGLSCCSLLAVPILGKGVLRAVLLLENRLSRGAFSTDRLDAVLLIAGQLVISLENALLYEELERRVEQRTQELTTANEALQAQIIERKLLESQLVQAQKLESLGQLASGIAHEINTPVQFVSDGVHFVAQGFADIATLIATYRAAIADATLDAPEIAATMRAAEEAADLDYLCESIPGSLERSLDGLGRITAIVRSMKDFAHPSGKDPSDVDLNQNLRSTLTISASEWRHVADIETDLGELPLVRCYAGEINQVILNILVNAAHAIADVVAGTDRKGVIAVRSRRDGDHVLVSITDTGGGIPDGIRHRIFDPFFTTKGVGRGTGQGLAIARGIVVTHHGGSLTFDTTLGGGTTFNIRLRIDGPVRDVGNDPAKPLDASKEGRPDPLAFPR